MTKKNPFSTIHRRTFLLNASAAVGTIASNQLMPRQLRAGSTPASDRIRIGAIGVGGRGTLLLQQLPESAELVAKSPAQEIPNGLDWNRWLNQAESRPYNKKWMGWMKWRDFAGGEMTNWGAHGVDAASQYLIRKRRPEFELPIIG